MSIETTVEEDVILCMGPETEEIARATLGRADLRHFRIETPPAGWHKQTPILDPAWAFVARHMRQTLDALGAESFRRLHVFANSPFSLGALLSCQLEYRFGRDREIHIYQFDQSDPAHKRWRRWGMLGQPMPAASPVRRLSVSAVGDADARHVAVALNVVQRIARAEVEPALQGLGACTWIDLGEPATLPSPEEAGALAAEIDELLRTTLPALFPQAELHVFYAGPLGALLLGAAKLHLASRPITIYERIVHGDGFRFARVLRLPHGRLSAGDGVIFLALIDEWFSRKGGISTFNRELCRALARSGYRVLCYLTGPEAALTREAVESAAGDGVKLLLTPPDEAPDVVIGHDHITGREALRLTRDRYSASRCALLIHTAPDEIEWYKNEGDEEQGRRAQEKTEAQARLAAEADVVFAVGPRLKDDLYGALRARNLPRDHLHELRPWLVQVQQAASEPPPRLRCLLVGRPEHKRNKGIDLAVRAIEGLRDLRPTLYVRGATPGTTGDLRDQLRTRLGERLRIELFDSNEERNATAFRSATLVLMPSRSEGFGLVGLEAIAYRVPVLVSADSGLGEVLLQAGTEACRGAVVSMSGDDEEDVPRWRHAIERKLERPGTAYAEAQQLYSDLQERLAPEQIIPSFVQRCLNG